MDSFDVMGPRPDRRAAFTGSLLAHEDDDELNAIVAEAAAELGVPLAMVNLVLDHVQRFRASHGLTGGLAAAKGTDRDVSFCQIVASEGRPLEVRDAAQDPRVPQFLVESQGVRAYLGVPVKAKNVVVGALCVLSDQPRTFSEGERRVLLALSERVNVRLDQLAEAPDPVAMLQGRSAVPTLGRLRETLAPIASSARAGLLALEGIRPLLGLVGHQNDTGNVDRALLAHTLGAAQRAIRSCDDALCEVEASVGDAAVAIQALEQLFVANNETRLLPAALAGRELSRDATAAIGGVFVPDTASPTIATPQPLAVTLVNAALSRLAAEMAGSSGGLRMEVLGEEDDEPALRISGPEMPPDVPARVAADLATHLAAVETVRVTADVEALWFHFVRRGSALGSAT